ncbi:Protein of unknown function [Gryllus bimaculatus]|nr:Protein of unknown function [Gryllus bimaculatus]
MAPAAHVGLRAAPRRAGRPKGALPASRRLDAPVAVAMLRPAAALRTAGGVRPHLQALAAGLGPAPGRGRWLPGGGVRWAADADSSRRPAPSSRYVLKYVINFKVANSKLYEQVGIDKKGRSERDSASRHYKRGWTQTEGQGPMRCLQSSRKKVRIKEFMQKKHSLYFQGTTLKDQKAQIVSATVSQFSRKAKSTIPVYVCKLVLRALAPAVTPDEHRAAPRRAVCGRRRARRPMTTRCARRGGSSRKQPAGGNGSF